VAEGRPNRSPICPAGIPSAPAWTSSRNTSRRDSCASAAKAARASNFSIVPLLWKYGGRQGFRGGRAGGCKNQESCGPSEQGGKYDALAEEKALAKVTEWREAEAQSRGAWHLNTYDVNEAGQVHTYLRYLAYLPYQEQLYWQSFNEWPKGFVSRRAFRTDFMGEWSTDYDPLHAVKRKVERLDEASPEWWKPRGREVARAVHYPVTGSEAEWAEAILALDQLVIEGFQDRPLKRIALGMRRTLENDWRSLKLMEECLVGKGAAEDEAKAAVDALRRVRQLRTTVKGHAAPPKKADAVKKAQTVYGSFRAHFEALAADCDDALGLVMARMEIGND
jgi:hypothetical protein